MAKAQDEIAAIVHAADFDESNSHHEDYEIEDSMAEISIASKTRRLWSFLCTPIITVLVGPEEQGFCIHRDLLRRHSLFFRKMLRGDGFHESKTQVVKLPDNNVTTFAVFAEWLYVGHEANSGDILINMHGNDSTEQNNDFPDTTKPDTSDHQIGEGGKISEPEKASTSPEIKEEIDNEEKRNDNDENEEEKEEEVCETGSNVDPGARHDHYDFSFQFSCYVLADKLMAPEFKRHILDEIHFYGEFCHPSDLTADMIRYIYQNTVNRNDPLRKFCIAFKCIQAPIDQTLADPDFQELMEEGGPLVRDVMEICKKYATRESWHDHSQEIDIEAAIQESEP